MSDVLLECKNLSTCFYTESSIVKAVNEISFDIKKGETLGIAGESGCGKSALALSLMRLIQSPAKISGEILFCGKDLLKLSQNEMRKLRGCRIAMIFQEPMNALNPVLTVGSQISEVILLHNKTGRSAAKQQAIELIKRVGIAEPEEIYKVYPHELSGGMRQRIMIAMAVACNPDLLIADEPTTSLDVTIQAQIIELLKSLQKEYKMSVLLISHDLRVLAETADRIIIMYAGRIVEEAKTEDILKKPMHPYTKGLLDSMPDPFLRKDRLIPIPGQVLQLADLPEYCSFADRCFKCSDKCRVGIPPLTEATENHKAACWLRSCEVGI